MNFSVETTLGEILDRLSILEIKQSKGMDVCTRDLAPFKSGFDELYQELVDVNSTLWDMEDDIRLAHQEGDVDGVVELSKKIIDNNAHRAMIKKKINDKIGQVNEPKHYTGFECS